MKRTKNIRKRFHIVILIFLLAITVMSGCGKDDGDERKTDNNKSNVTGTPTATQTVEPTATPTAAAPSMPSELIGTWHGIGKPDEGGSDIDLTVRIKEDGTGSYTFVQAGYTEDYGFSVTFTDTTFSVDIPETTDIFFASCDGTWALKDGKLVLNIATKFKTGRVYAYTAVCEKQ